jgi:hypothetical protein
VNGEPVWCCPDCDGDLDVEPFNFYCRYCQATVSYARAIDAGAIDDP